MATILLEKSKNETFFLLDSICIRETRQKDARKSSNDASARSSSAPPPIQQFDCSLIQPYKIWQNFERPRMLYEFTDISILHAIAGLFDVCLPDMDLDTIYDSIGSSDAFTLALFVDKSTQITRLQTKMQFDKKQVKRHRKRVKEILQDERLKLVQINSEDDTKKENKDKAEDEEDSQPEDIYESPEIPESHFLAVFSEDEEKDDEDEEMDDKSESDNEGNTQKEEKEPDDDEDDDNDKEEMETAKDDSKIHENRNSLKPEPKKLDKQQKKADKDEDEEEDDDEDDYSLGYKSFVKQAMFRKLTLLNLVAVGGAGKPSPQPVKDTTSTPPPTTADLADCVGPEHCIQAAASFKVRQVEGFRVIHLTLLAVRKPFRNLGLGSRLLQNLMRRTITGPYQFIVVHADYAAVPFFRKHGFTEDRLINSRMWREFANEYSNCQLMTFVPAWIDANDFDKLASSSAGSVVGAGGGGWSGSLASYVATDRCLSHIEMEMESCRERAEQSHLAQYRLFRTMRQQIVALNEHTLRQEQLIRSLMGQLRDQIMVGCAMNETHTLQQKREETKRTPENDSTTLEKCSHKSSQSSSSGSNGGAGSDFQSDSAIKHSSMSAKHALELDGHCLEKIRQHFEGGMSSGPSKIKWFGVFHPAIELSERFHKGYQLQKESWHFHGKPCRMLYYYNPSGGGSGDSESEHANLMEICKNGFTEHSMHLGGYGRGLYFSANPAVASIYAKSSHLLVAEVLLGNIAKNPSKIHKSRNPIIKSLPPSDYDSLLLGRCRLPNSDSTMQAPPLQSRPNSSSNNTSEPNSQQTHVATSPDIFSGLSEEYLVFTILQAMPLGLIEFHRDSESS